MKNHTGKNFTAIEGTFGTVTYYNDNNEPVMVSVDGVLTDGKSFWGDDGRYLGEYVPSAIGGGSYYDENNNLAGRRTDNVCGSSTFFDKNNDEIGFSFEQTDGSEFIAF